MGGVASVLFGGSGTKYTLNDDDLLLDMIQQNLEYDYDTYIIPDENPKLNKISAIGDKCQICKEYDIIHVIKPCGHRCLCNSCAISLPARGISNCPECNQKINEIV